MRGGCAPAVCFALLWFGVASNVAQAWTAVSSDQFDRAELGEHWQAAGDWTIVEEALKVQGAEGAELRLVQPLDKPAIRVSFQCWSEGSAARNVTVMIGVGAGGATSAGRFTIAAENNAAVRIEAPARPPLIVEGFALQRGRRYQVVAEANGPVLTLSINGNIVAQRLAVRALEPGQIVFTVAEGLVYLDHITIEAKDAPDRPGSILVRTRQTDESIDAYQPPRWNPADLPIRARTPRVADQKVSVQVRAPVASTAPVPVTFGVPLPDREMFNPKNVHLLDAAGKEIPAQFTPLATWDREDAIRWLLVDTQVPLAGDDQPQDYVIHYGRSVFPRTVEQPIQVEESADAVTVDTGVLKARFSRKRGSLIEQAWVKGQEVLAPSPQRGPFFVDQNGVRHQSRPNDADYRLHVEQAGPMRVVIAAEGWYANANGDRACRYETRIHLYRGQATMRIVHTWINTEDTDRLQFGDLGLDLSMTLPETARILVGSDDRESNRFESLAAAGGAVTALQTGLRRSRVEQGGEVKTWGRRLAGWMSVLGGERGVTLGVLDLGMQHPTALEASADGLRLLTWSGRAAATDGGEARPLDFRHEALRQWWGEDTWQRISEGATKLGPLESRVSNGLGFARTHELVLTFHGPDEAEAVRAGVLSQQPPLATVDPRWTTATGALDVDIVAVDTAGAEKWETAISRELDHYIEVSRSLDPYVGFWDYGRGCPNYIAQRTAADNEPQWFYSGLSANADMSHGNPETAWLMYLRSGERRYYDLARRMTRHLSDTRFFHWYSRELGREIGQSYSDLAAWVFDGRDAGWNGSVWPGALAMSFFVTGSQRDLDVLGDVMGEYLHSRRPPHHDPGVIYLGALAQLYRTTWQQPLMDQLEERSPYFLQRQAATGFWPSHDTWFEQALLRILALPKPRQNWVDIGQRFARGAVGSTRFHTSWALAAAIQAWANRREANILYAVNARESLSHGVPSSTGLTGLAPLRSTIVWLGLRDIPGVDRYVAPFVYTYVRPHETPFYFMHQSGRETYLELHYRQGEVKVTDPVSGQPISPLRLRSVRQVGIYEIRIPATEPTQQYRIQCELPSLYEAEDGSRLARSLPWRPGESELLLVMHGPIRFVQDISGGALTAQETPASFEVNPRVQELGIVGSDNWPATNELLLTQPGGAVEKVEGFSTSLKFSDDQRRGLWSVGSKFPYAVLVTSSFARGPLEPRYLRLEGVQPFVSPRPECHFLPAAAARPVVKSEPLADLVYPRGRFKRAVRLAGSAAFLQIPTGAAGADPSVRQWFNARQGTVEMFIQFDRRAIEGGYNGVLFAVPFANERAHMMQLVTSSTWEGFIRSQPGRAARQSRVNLLGSGCSPRIDPGVWYHLAVQWNTDDHGRFMRRVFLDGYPYAYGDAFGVDDPREHWPAAFDPGAVGDFLFVGDDGHSPRSTTACAIDELRISDVQRYPFMPGPPNVGGRRAFVPTDAPFEVDGRTLALFRFDGTLAGVSGDGQTLEARRIVRTAGDTLGLAP